NSRRFTASDSRASHRRIAHLGTVDCCIHPPGRHETIAVTPPIIFSKGGSPKTGHPISPPATSLTTRNRFTPNFRGWRLDEDLKPKSPPYRGGGAHINVRGQKKNEVGLAARAAMLRVGVARFIRMKSTSKKRCNGSTMVRPGEHRDAR